MNTTVRSNQLAVGLVSLYTWYGTLVPVSVATHDHFTSAVYRSTDSRAFTVAQGSLAYTSPPVRVVVTDAAGTAVNTVASSPSWSYSRQVSYGSSSWWASQLTSQRVAVRPGVAATLEPYTESVLETPPSTTPTATPATSTQTSTPAKPSTWYVRVYPKPESSEPTDVKVVVYTTDEVSPSDYSIRYTIYDEDRGASTSGTVVPQPIYDGARLLGYGYSWELKGDSRKRIDVVVKYKDQDFMTATRWNYSK